jgi:hypothetical protein
MKGQVAASNKYNKANTKAYTFRLDLTYDKELIQYMETLENKSGWFKEIIRQEMAKSK